MHLLKWPVSSNVVYWGQQLCFVHTYQISHFQFVTLELWVLVYTHPFAPPSNRIFSLELTSCHFQARASVYIPIFSLFSQHLARWHPDTSTISILKVHIDESCELSAWSRLDRTQITVLKTLLTACSSSSAHTLQRHGAADREKSGKFNIQLNWRLKWQKTTSWRTWWCSSTWQRCDKRLIAQNYKSYPTGTKSVI